MKSIIIGAGKYGEVYLSYLQEQGINIIGFLDDDLNIQGKNVKGIPVLGPISLLRILKETRDITAVYCPLGNNRLRVEFLETARVLGYLTPNFIHKDVKIAPNVKIASQGVYILGNSYIMPHVEIGKDVMISVGANIIHHTKLNQGVFISNGVNLGASLEADFCAYVGMGATVMTGVHRLGRDCLIGAGAAVIRDVPDGAIMAGVPAKIIRYKSEYSKN